MAADDRRTRAGSRDPRAAALARYLRQCAAAFSMSADVMDTACTAEAGMALLDAAAIAEKMTASDPRIRALSEAGVFESLPDGRARVVETARISAAIRRPLVSDPRAGVDIIADLVAAAHDEGTP